MKYLICTISAIAVLSYAHAQEGGVYLKGGLNLANVSTHNNGSVDDANMLASFHVGFMADLPIGRFFALQPGILFTGKGAKLESGNPNGVTWYKATTNPYYIELPVNAVLKLPLDKQSSLFVGAGPYIAMGIAGKRKVEGKFLGASFSSKENIQFSDDDPSTLNYEEGAGMRIMRRFDYGVNATAGLMLNKFLLSVNYGYGLAKLQSGANNGEDNNNKHRVLSLSIGFGL